jgi:uncharacterized protein (DUF58 family)
MSRGVEADVPRAGPGEAPEAGPFPGWTAGLRVALDRLRLARRRPAGGHLPGAVRSPVRGRALEFADYRPYTPGDEPRLVDWRAYARLGRLYLKQYDEERARGLTLLVDASASLDWGAGGADGGGGYPGRDAHKGRYARRLAATLAWISLGRHEPATVYLLQEGGATALPVAGSRAGAPALFRRLEGVREAGRTDLASALRAIPPPRPRGPVVLLSDLLDPEWGQALDRLGALGVGEGVVLQVLAPEEWEPGLDDEVELEDAETGERRPARLGPLEVAAYRDRLSAFLDEIRARCARLGLVHVALDSGAPLQDAVLRRLPAAGALEAVS